MSWFSILPQSISFIETGLIRFFLVLGLITIGPWLLLIIYDLVLYLFRTATYDLPYIGGRARNRPRPRAPSLSERPSGRARGFSLTMPGATTVMNSVTDTKGGLKERLSRPEYVRGNSSVILDDE